MMHFFSCWAKLYTVYSFLEALFKCFSTVPKYIISIIVKSHHEFKFKLMQLRSVIYHTDGKHALINACLLLAAALWLFSPFEHTDWT